MVILTWFVSRRMRSGFVNPTRRSRWPAQRPSACLAAPRSGAVAQARRSLFLRPPAKTCAAGALCALGLALVLLAGCGGNSGRAPIGHHAAGRAKPPAPPGVHIVQRGDTLYSIAWRFGVDFRALASRNKVSPPYVIFPGQRLSVMRKADARANRSVRKRPASIRAGPRGDIPPNRAGQSTAKAARRAPRPLSRTHSAEKSTNRQPGSASQELSRRRDMLGPSSLKKINWAWPVKGVVIRRYNQQGNRGLDIAGRSGTRIGASAPGRVVYSGSGLIGYGKLIIIKHNAQFLTAYAHNNKILVSEGETVARGTPIAEMGSTGTSRVKLHFEIRKDGSPVNPARYLPKL